VIARASHKEMELEGPKDLRARLGNA